MPQNVSLQLSNHYNNSANPVQIAIDQFDAFIEARKKENPKAHSYLDQLRVGLVHEVICANMYNQVNFSKWLEASKNRVEVLLQKFKQKNELYGNNQADTRNKTNQQAEKISNHDSKASLPAFEKKERKASQFPTSSGVNTGIWFLPDHI